MISFEQPVIKRKNITKDLIKEFRKYKFLLKKYLLFN